MIARLLSLAAALALAACNEDNTPVCRPDTQVDCFCYTGAPGRQTCDETGLEYGECECLPDAGVADDAATPDASSPDASVPDAAPPT
jgi:hypothetical protein